MKKCLLIFLYYSIFSGSYVFSSEHIHHEKYYQTMWCKQHNGITEYINKDRTRVDCLTATEAVEVDFAYKWAQAVGQALYYGYITDKKPKVVLILENPEKEIKILNRVKELAKIYNFEVEYVTPKTFIHPLGT